jgi:ATP-dependent DNA helicase RecQ
LRELGFDPVLHQKLKAKRDEIANAEGIKPASTIFSDQTLELFTRLQPTSLDAGQSIRGVGPLKAERYLPHFLEVIAEHRSAIGGSGGKR